MAKIQQRRRADGGISYRVMWVIGGGRPIAGAGSGEPGSQASETFTDRKLMLAFKAAVEAQEHRWPVGWVKGRGWVEPASQPDAPAPATLDDVYAAWLAAERIKLVLHRKKPKSLGRDVSTYRRVIQPRFGDRPFVTIHRAEVGAWAATMTVTSR